MKLPGMIWRDGEFVAEQVAVDGLAELVAAPDQLSWIDLRHPAVEQLAALGKELGFDAHTIEDALSPRERPKTVRYSGYTFSLVAAANLGVKKASGSRLHLSYLGVYSIGGCLITVQQGAPFDMQPVVERWRDDRDLVAFGVDGLLQAVLDVVVDQYTAVLQRLDEELDGVADQLFVANPDSKGLQQQAFSIRRELSELRRIITPMREAVATLIHNGQGAKNWSPELLSYYEDLSDHLLRATEWGETLRELVSTVHETNLALNDARMNAVMKKMAAWAGLVAVPTLITGWFGMNVPYPGFAQPWGFWLSTTVIIGAVAGIFVIFRRNDWF